MKPTLLFKIASGLLAFFGVAHTLGMFSEDEGAVKAVVKAMQTVHFDVMGSSRSLFDFYMGFGLLLTVFLLFSAVLSWQLGNLIKENSKIARSLAWPFAVCQIGVAILGWTNFFLAPQLVSTLAAACLVMAAWQSGKSYDHTL